MYFRLPCACGKDLSVSEGASGAALRCSCGRQIIVPELTELRQRAAAGEIACSRYADGEQPPPPPSPVAEAARNVVCWLVLLLGGLIVLLGAGLWIAIGGIGYLAMVVGIAVMGLAARALASRDDLRAARARERQEYLSLCGPAHAARDHPVDERIRASPTERPAD